MSEGFVYSLGLEDGRYYVGWSADPATRIAQHFLGRGAQWTRTHAPVKVLSVVPGGLELEDATTIAMMIRHGWRKVRGGKWLSVQMPCAPPPILKAYATKPPKEATNDVGEDCETLAGHQVRFGRAKTDGEPHAWRARVYGPRAAEACPCRGVKTIYGPTEDALRSLVTFWLKDGDADSTDAVNGSETDARELEQRIEALALD